MRLRTLLAYPALAIGMFVSFAIVVTILVVSFLSPLAEFGPLVSGRFVFTAAIALSIILPLTAWFGWRLGGRTEASAAGDERRIRWLLIVVVAIVVAVTEWLCCTLPTR